MSEQNRTTGAESQRDQSQAAQPGGTYEPRDSRTVTGQGGGGGVGAPGGADQQEGRERWSGEGQPSQSQGEGEQGVPSGAPFSAEEAARAQQLRQGQQGAAGQQSQMGYGSGQQGSGQQGTVDPEALGFVDQQTEANRGEAVTGGSGQQSQFASPGASQQGEGSQGLDDRAGSIRPHMEVVGADGVHIGTVDHVDGNRIKLVKADSGMGSHKGHHHYISSGLVAGIDGNRVRLSATAANAYAMEEEE